MTGDSGDSTLLLNRNWEKEEGKVEGREAKKKESAVTTVTPSPDVELVNGDKEERYSNLTNLPRDLKEFKAWLSKLPNKGLRGFYEKDVREVYGPKYLESMTHWLEKSWLERRPPSVVLWVPDDIKAVLAGGAA